MDSFINNPYVMMRCMTFYLERRAPTMDEFEILLTDLRNIATECGLCNNNETKEELYKKLITHERITAFLNN